MICHDDGAAGRSALHRAPIPASSLGLPVPGGKRAAVASFQSNGSGYAAPILFLRIAAPCHRRTSPQSGSVPQPPIAGLKSTEKGTTHWTSFGVAGQFQSLDLIYRSWASMWPAITSSGRGQSMGERERERECVRVYAIICPIAKAQPTRRQSAFQARSLPAQDCDLVQPWKPPISRNNISPSTNCRQQKPAVVSQQCFASDWIEPWGLSREFRQRERSLQVQEHVYPGRRHRFDSTLMTRWKEPR